jgi:hypothetical protein
MPDQPVVLINAFKVPPDDGNRFLGDCRGRHRESAENARSAPGLRLDWSGDYTIVGVKFAECFSAGRYR